MKKYKIGDTVMFRNDYAYPSRTGQTAKVTLLARDDYDYDGIQFDSDGMEMAVLEHELRKIED